MELRSEGEGDKKQPHPLKAGLDWRQKQESALPPQSRFASISERARMSSGRIATNLGFTGLPRQIYLLIGITFALSLGRNIAFPYLAIYLTSGASNGGLGIDPSIVGFMLMVGGLTSIAMLLVTGSLCDRVGRRKTTLIYAIPLIFLTLALVRYLAMGVHAGVRAYGRRRGVLRPGL